MKAIDLLNIYMPCGTMREIFWQTKTVYSKDLRTAVHLTLITPQTLLPLITFNLLREELL